MSLSSIHFKDGEICFPINVYFLYLKYYKIYNTDILVNKIADL